MGTPSLVPSFYLGLSTSLSPSHQAAGGGGVDCHEEKWPSTPMCGYHWSLASRHFRMQRWPREQFYFPGYPHMISFWWKWVFEHPKVRSWGGWCTRESPSEFPQKRAQIYRMGCFVFYGWVVGCARVRPQKKRGFPSILFGKFELRFMALPGNLFLKSLGFFDFVHTCFFPPCVFSMWPKYVYLWHSGCFLKRIFKT